MTKFLQFLTWPAIAGVLAALLILDRWVLPGEGAEQPGTTAPTSYAQAVAAATGSVVNIYTVKRVDAAGNPLLQDPFFRRFQQARSNRQRTERSLGSGVIMSAEGHVLTNNHVIAGADRIQIMLQDGRTATAIVIGSDPATDLAVLQIELPGLTPITLGDSDTARVGDVVLAIGNPLGFGHTVTQGIVSALGRYGLRRSLYEDYIQTDATIHLGNSGGALIDTQGRLLGINTLFYTSQAGSADASTGIGISLAIPVNLATFVMQDLIQYGEVVRGWLGVSVGLTRDVNSDGVQRMVLEVESVAPGSPALKAGLMAGDRITHINGEQVQDGRVTLRRMALLRPGDEINVSVLRDGQSLALQAVVGLLNQSPVADS
ncbi:MAG: trypsin-like peptidase domain-containing protein [Pseudomonadota bacterium]